MQCRRKHITVVTTSSKVNALSFISKNQINPNNRKNIQNFHLHQSSNVGRRLAYFLSPWQCPHQQSSDYWTLVLSSPSQRSYEGHDEGFRYLFDFLKDTDDCKVIDTSHIPAQLTLPILSGTHRLWLCWPVRWCCTTCIPTQGANAVCWCYTNFKK